MYRDTVLQTPYLKTHNIQAEEYSCQVASASNILKALGFDITEEEVACSIGKKGNVKSNVWPKDIIEYLEKEGLEVKRINNTLEAIELLIAGAKIVLPLQPPKYPYSHTIIISGVKIDHGNIEFYINDPNNRNHAEKMPLSNMINNIMPHYYLRVNPVYAISKPDSTS